MKSSYVSGKTFVLILQTVSSQIQDDQEKPCICCLQEALREYSGTVIAVSHDRYFLRQIVNRVVEVKNEELIDYVGDYNVILFSSSFSKLSMQITGGQSFVLIFHVVAPGQYYLEQNLEARRRELEREEELEAKAPTVKAKSKMSKVFHCQKANF